MTPRTITFLKVVIACAAVVTLVAVPARELAPRITLAELVLFIAGAFGALVVLSVCSLQLVQFILRKGGTDPQWFWFSGEPPGLGRAHKHELPKTLFISSGLRATLLTVEAQRLGITVVGLADDQLLEIVEEARESFREHIGGGRTQ